MANHVAADTHEMDPGVQALEQYNYMVNVLTLMTTTHTLLVSLYIIVDVYQDDILSGFLPLNVFETQDHIVLHFRYQQIHAKNGLSKKDQYNQSHHIPYIWPSSPIH